MGRGNFCKSIKEKIKALAENHPEYDENFYNDFMGNMKAFGASKNLTMRIMPGFKTDDQGRRNMTSLRFPKDLYLLKCPTHFGNPFTDSPEEIERKFEESRRISASSIAKNKTNPRNNRPDQWVGKGIPPYCV